MQKQLRIITSQRLAVCPFSSSTFQVPPVPASVFSRHFRRRHLHYRPLVGCSVYRLTCGWYLWADEEMSEDDDFFKPMHVYHLIERCPNVVKYLALPPGWRFLLAGDHEDVWFDAKLLAT